jgi:hypothetical protein
MQKDSMESSRYSLKNGAEVFVLFLHGVQLALRSSVLTVMIDLNVMLKYAETFPSLLF